MHPAMRLHLHTSIHSSTSSLLHQSLITTSISRSGISPILRNFSSPLSSQPQILSSVRSRIPKLPEFPHSQKHTFGTYCGRAFCRQTFNTRPTTTLPRPFPFSTTTQIRVGLFAGIASLFSSKSSSNDPAMSSDHTFPVQKSDSEWRTILTPQQFRVLRQQATEPAHTGEYDKHYPTAGAYTCAGCNTPLYTARTKFSSGCGWPAFYDAIPGKVLRKEDRSFGVTRTEIVCAECGGHLGHVFKGEGFDTPTDERHCVNSVSLRFTEEEEGHGSAGGSKA